jgi:hypothetical protein
MADAGTQPRNDPDPPVVEALRLVRSHQITLFCDRAGIPCLRLGNVPADTWSLRSERAHAWVTLCYETKTGKVLRKSEVHDVLRVLEGQAYQNPSENSDDEQLWRHFEEEPLLQAVYDFMEGKERWENPTESLLAELRKVAIARNIDTYTKKWPAIARLLSARLNRLHGLLAQAGISVRVEHRREGSWVILTKTPRDVGDGKSSPASQPASPHVTTFPEADAGDDGDDEKEAIEQICQLVPERNGKSGGP